LPSTDLDQVLDQTRGVWEELRGARLFVTGGTGFFGSWLLESMVHAELALGLGLRAVVLTRDPESFRARRPALAASTLLSFTAGDIRDFSFPAGNFSHVIHAATDTSAALNAGRADEMRDVIVSGMKRVLDFTSTCGAQRLLLASSGAVYGRQRPETTHLAEDDDALFTTSGPSSAYAEGKREAERLCREAAGRRGLQPVIARGFAFLGPHLPLDAQYAAGNFVRDALRGGPIQVCGDGSPYRSYLYASDLAAWLWTILVRGASGRAYNVGSERRVTVAELAQTVAAVLSPGVDVRIAKLPAPNVAPEQYVPSTRRAREELGLREIVSLEEAIRRTGAWASAASKSV